MNGDECLAIDDCPQYEFKNTAVMNDPICLWCPSGQNLAETFTKDYNAFVMIGTTQTDLYTSRCYDCENEISNCASIR